MICYYLGVNFQAQRVNVFSLIVASSDYVCKLHKLVGPCKALCDRNLFLYTIYMNSTLQGVKEHRE